MQQKQVHIKGTSMWEIFFRIKILQRKASLKVCLYYTANALRCRTGTLLHRTCDVTVMQCHMKDYLFISFIYNIRRMARQIPIMQMHKFRGCHPETHYLRSPVLDAGGKTRGPGENLQKQAWPGNQMHKCQDWGWNPGLTGAKRRKTRYANLLPLIEILT